MKAKCASHPLNIDEGYFLSMQHGFPDLHTLWKNLSRNPPCKSIHPILLSVIWPIQPILPPYPFSSHHAKHNGLPQSCIVFDYSTLQFPNDAYNIQTKLTLTTNILHGSFDVYPIFAKNPCSIKYAYTFISICASWSLQALLYKLIKQTEQICSTHSTPHLKLQKSFKKIIILHYKAHLVMIHSQVAILLPPFWNTC